MEPTNKNIYITVGNTAQTQEYVGLYDDLDFFEQRKKQNKTQPKKRATTISLPYLIILSIAMIVTLFICVDYLQLQSDMTARIKNISKLESELESLKSDNDNLDKRINTSVDLDYVYKVATEELGMVYAKKSQVRFYERSEQGYIRQLEDIPEE